MAARRVAKSAVDWAAFAERVPANQKEAFRAFKAKSDFLVSRCVAAFAECKVKRVTTDTRQNLANFDSTSFLVILALCHLAAHRLTIPQNNVCRPLLKVMTWVCPQAQGPCACGCGQCGRGCLGLALLAKSILKSQKRRVPASLHFKSSPRVFCQSKSHYGRQVWH